MKPETQAQVLVEALPYIQKYRGKTIVIKYGGNAMIDEALKMAVIQDVVLLSEIGIKVILVPVSYTHLGMKRTCESPLEIRV